MLNFSVKSNGQSVGIQVSQMSAAVKKAMKQALTQSGTFMVSSIQNGFTEGKDPEGKPWARLDPVKYPNRPERDGIVRPPSNPTNSSSKPLINHGRLRGSLNFVSVSEGVIKVGYGTPETAEIGMNQQLGLPSLMKIIDEKGRDRSRMVTPIPRPQVGFSAWPRWGGMPDHEAITSFFKAELDKVAI